MPLGVSASPLFFKLSESSCFLSNSDNFWSILLPAKGSESSGNRAPRLLILQIRAPIAPTAGV